MSKYLILHGTGATPNDNWFMWLKGVLVGQGHQVWLPQLPGSDKPNAKTYTDFLLANCPFDFDSETVIIGHSSGSVAALYLLQSLPADAKTRAAVLVSAFKDDLGWDTLKELFVEPLDFTLIKNHAAEFTFIHSDDDPYCSLDGAKYLAEQTNGSLVVFEGQGHFNTLAAPDYQRFPELLSIIETSSSNL